MNTVSDTQRDLPYNLEAEQLLLGSMIINNNVYYIIEEIINTDSFHLGIHRKIFDAICGFRNRDIVATPVTLKNMLEDQLADVGGSDYLVLLASKASIVIDVLSLAKIISELSLRRKLIKIGESIVNNAFDDVLEIDPIQQIAEAEKHLYNISQYNDKGRVFTIAESVDKAVSDAKIAADNKDSVIGVPTDFIDLDRLLAGLHKSDLIILAARPSMGKTALSVNIAVNAAKHFKQKDLGCVAFFSLEMSSDQLAMRILSMETGINSSKIRTGMMNSEDFKSMMKSAGDIKKLPIIIDDTASLSITHLRSRVRRLCRVHNITLVLIDYLQLLHGSKKYSDSNRVQEVSEVTQGLKSIAKEMYVPVVALSQLSRSVEQRDDKRPQLSDLRDSGSIEQDADVVIFIYREAYYLMRQQPAEGTDQHIEWQHKMEKVRNRCDLIVAKQRNGPIGNVKLHFDISTTRFSNIAEYYNS